MKATNFVAKYYLQRIIPYIMKALHATLISTLIAAGMSSCSNDKVSSKSPTLGDLTVTPARLYTGQKATVGVSFADYGEHVYFSSSAYFTCLISESGRKTDSIPVFKDQDLRVPTNFSFPVTLPLAPGNYTLTVRTPSVNKSSTSSEGESLLFPSLSKQTTIIVQQADAINANFGDSRETVAGYITVSDTTFEGSTFDPAGKASAKTTSNSFTRQLVYKFNSNKLTEVDDEYTYDFTGIIRDENAKVTISDDDVAAIMNKANELFISNIADELLSGDTYQPESAKATYGTLAADNDASKWKPFLTDLVDNDKPVKSYSFRCRHAKSGSLITVTLTVLNGKMFITNKYTK